MSAHEPVNILLVDDTPGKLMSYEVILQELGENLIKVSSAKEALVELLRKDVALILTDVCMPDLDGFEFASLLRQHPRCERTAVIFISAVHLSDVDYVRGYNCGAVDYVTVPVVPEILRAKVKIFVELYRKTKELEELNNALEARVADRTKKLESSTARLTESEQRLRLASQAAAFGTYDYEIGADRIHWSSEPRPLTEAGRSAPHSLKELLELVHPDDREAVRSSMLDPIVADEERHELEFRTIQHGAERWVLNRGQALRQRTGDYQKPVRVVGTMLDITHRKSAEAHQALLMAELDHRVKNILANVLAIASLSSSNASSVPTFVNALQGRIQSMATAHDLLRRNNWRGADFHSLAREALKPFQSAEGNVEITGPTARLSPKAAQSVALVFHELATNAVKHGALSRETGRVAITAQASNRPGKFRFTWQESGGPPVAKPSKRGFGLTAMRAAAQEADAQAEIAFEPEGLVYSLECSLASLDDFPAEPPRPTNGNARTNAASTPIRSEATRRRRILIVEDEPLVAAELQKTLESEGHEVVGPAPSLTQGLALAQSEAFDLAFLDISLGAETSEPIARKLAAMGIPFTFVTGYSDPGTLPPELREVPRIGKPYAIEQLRRAIALATDRSSSGLRASA